MVPKGKQIRLFIEDNAPVVVVAAAKGNAAVVKGLLDNKYGKVDDKDSRGSTALHAAAANADFEMAKILLGRGADITCKNADGLIAADFAASTGHMPLTLAILPSNASMIDRVIGIAREYGHPALADAIGPMHYDLHRAAKEGLAELVAISTKTRPASLNAKDADGKTALTLAVENGHAEAVKELLACKDTEVDPGVFQHAICTGKVAVATEYVKADRIDFPLRRATREGAAAAVGAFLFAASPRMDDVAKALFLAAKDGNLEIVRILLPRASLRAVEHALFGAVHEGQLACAEALLGQVAMDEDTAETVLEMAAAGPSAGVLRAVMKHPAVQQEMKTAMPNALMAAFRAGRTDNVACLADPVRPETALSERDGCGLTPLLAAVLRRDAATVRILLECGADPTVPYDIRLSAKAEKGPCEAADHPVRVGMTPAMLALEMKSVDILRVFFEECGGLPGVERRSE